MSASGNPLTTDPLLRKIKALSKIDSNSRTQFMERTRVAEERFQAVLLPEEWLEMSPAYLTLPPTLANQSYSSILKVIDFPLPFMSFNHG
jgi:hypothetical protein